MAHNLLRPPCQPRKPLSISRQYGGNVTKAQSMRLPMHLKDTCIELYYCVSIKCPSSIIHHNAADEVKFSSNPVMDVFTMQLWLTHDFLTVLIQMVQIGSAKRKHLVLSDSNLVYQWRGMVAHGPSQHQVKQRLEWQSWPYSSRCSTAEKTPARRILWDEDAA